MGIVRDCRDFDRLWNERLDARAARAGGSEPPLASASGHACGCESCQCRDAIYGELEASPSFWPKLPAPSPEATARWAAAAMAMHRDLGPIRARRRRRIAFAARASLAAASAAAALVGSKALLPLLFPIEPAPVVRVDHSSSVLLEEAFAEAGTMTWDLAREVSAPAARISSEALRLGDSPPLVLEPPAPRERPALMVREEEGSTPTAGVELISGSARHAFRFLLGTTADDAPDPGTVGGY